MGKSNAVKPVLATDSTDRSASPNLYETTAEAFLGEDHLAEEVFGPLGLVVRAGSPEDMERIARGFPGQLTATLHTDPGDAGLAHRLLPAAFLLRGLGLVDDRPDQPAPVDSNGATPLSGLWAVGTCVRPDVNHITSLSDGLVLGTHLAALQVTAP